MLGILLYKRGKIRSMILLLYISLEVILMGVLIELSM